MSCNPELVSAFIDGELDNIIVNSVTKHLLKCDSCCHMMSRLAQVRDVVSDKFTLPDPEGLTASVMAAINNEKITSNEDILRRRLIRFGVPAAIAAAAIAGSIQQSIGQERDAFNPSTFMADSGMSQSFTK
ncbi:MAG: hypothetical protein HQL52_09150 [Magnetococcales bacterium]|nr:hypothetical protein [Magnetococcales bacterium]